MRGAAGEDWVAFLQWALVRLDLRWKGFRRVRRQVRRRVRRRMEALGVADLAAYRARLEARPEEWSALDACCRVTISRFYRDRAVFEALGVEVLPALAERTRREGRARIEAWCAGCASGEEPYTLVALWESDLRGRFPDVDLGVVATDTDPRLLERAREARYPAARLRDLPPRLREAAFEPAGDAWRSRAAARRRVRFLLQDVRHRTPGGRFDLVLCRNLVFTYYAEPLQRRLLEELALALRPGGALVLGVHEDLPPATALLVPWAGARSVYRRPAAAPPRRVGEGAGSD